jgi:hypothetical protein
MSELQIELQEAEFRIWRDKTEADYEEMLENH